MIDQTKHLSRLIASGVFNNIIPVKRYLVAGNKKLPNTTAIFNMGSATDCPSRKLGLCSACKAGVKCYALKAELPCWPAVLPFRRRQEKFWKETNPENFVLQFLALNAIKTKPFNALRFNEAGDFWSQECVKKAEKIARILNTYNVVVYCYTSRSDLDYGKISALRISGSGFKKKGVKEDIVCVN